MLLSPIGEHFVIRSIDIMACNFNRHFEQKRKNVLISFCFKPANVTVEYLSKITC